MKQDLAEFTELLVSIIVDNTVHQDYDRVVELAKMYYSFVTGDGLDDMMKQFVMRETKEAFDQRKKLTEHVIPAVVSNITSVERKVPRSNGMTRVVAYKDDEKFKRAKELEKILDVFWGDQSFDNWMSTRWIELNDIDPNSFTVIEWQPPEDKTKKVSPYPYESKAAEAIMFEYENNILQYLVDQKDDKYTMYLQNQTIQAAQITEDDPIYKFVLANAVDEGVIIEIEGRFFFKKTEKVYYELITFKPHNLDRVPAFRAGYKRDGETDGRTYISPYHEAVPHLKKTIKANSELDLTMALHAFPQKIVTGNKCTGEKCMEGMIYTEEGASKKCTKCEGTGMEVHKSTQDVIVIPIPKAKEEQLSLDNMVRYITPETSLLDFQQRYIEYLTDECMQAVFNSDIFTKEDIATTATEKRIDLDNIYDTLYPLSVRYSKLWKYGVDLVADITKLGGKQLITVLTFSKDFKFKSKDDYIRDRRNAMEAGAPDMILRNIDDEIIRIDTAENPHEYQVFKTVESFDPFSGKTEEEIVLALTSNTVPFDVKVLYNNLGWIFDDIFLENENFFQMPRQRQVKIVDEKVAEIVTELDANQTKRAEFEPEE